MASGWMRFTTDDGVVYGQVAVPARPPKWFVLVLRDLNQGSKREITMEDFTPEEWADWCCSKSQPIPLLKPLSPTRVEESVYFHGDEAIEGFKAAYGKAVADLGGEKSEKAIVQANAMRRDDEWCRKNGMLTIEDLAKIDPDKRKEYYGIPRSQVQPGKQHRTSVSYVPMMDGEEENMDEFVLYPARINNRVSMNKDSQFSKVVANSYGISIDEARAKNPLAGSGVSIAGRT